MVKEAAEHEAEDKKRREEIERRNKLDNLCYTLEKQISENKDKLEGTDLSAIEGLIKEGREAVEKQDDDKVTDVLGRLEKEAYQMASKLYESAGGGAPPPDGDGGGATNGNGAPGGEAPPQEEGRRRDRRRVRRDELIESRVKVRRSPAPGRASVFCDSARAMERRH